MSKFDFNEPITSDIDLYGEWDCAEIDPDNPTLGGLKAAIDKGDIFTFPPTTLIPDVDNEGNTYNWVVGHYGFATMSDGQYMEGVYLFRENAYPTPQVFGTSKYYELSTIAGWIESEILSKCSDTLQSLVGEIKVNVDLSYNRSINQKMWLMSEVEVLGDSPSYGPSVEPWKAWNIRTGLIVANLNANTGRVIKTSAGANVDWWLRDYYSVTSTNVNYVDTSGVTTAGAYSNSHYVVPAVFIPAKRLTLTEFNAALKDGTAQEKYPVGATVYDTISTKYCPWVVGHYSVAALSDGSSSIGAYLFRKLSIEMSSSMGSVDYGGSTINTYLTGTGYNNCTDEFKNIVSEIQVPYSLTTGEIKFVSAPQWLMSTTETLGTGATAELGEPWEYWAKITGLNEPNDSNNFDRIYRQFDGIALNWWTRSILKNSTNYYCAYTNSGGRSGYVYTTNAYLRPACFIAGQEGYKVTFNANGGTPEPPSQLVVANEHATRPHDPTKDNYQFVGWFYEGQTYDTIGEIPVMFRVNGGTPQPATQYVQTGDKAITPPTPPTKDGYEFLGWYKAGEIPDDWDGVTII